MAVGLITVNKMNVYVCVARLICNYQAKHPLTSSGRTHLPGAADVFGVSRQPRYFINYKIGCH